MLKALNGEVCGVVVLVITIVRTHAMHNLPNLNAFMVTLAGVHLKHRPFAVFKNNIAHHMILISIFVVDDTAHRFFDTWIGG